ncbi:MAG: hypothetical protein FWF51_09580, partial [Chitinivibrionia bacterium]|nr:hypothetical protein [Chitinivibrionia bacterium]
VAAVNQASDIAKAGINNAAQNITGNIAGGKLGGLAKGGLKGAAQSIGNAAANAAVNQAVDIVQTINNVARNDTQSYLFLAFRYMLLSPIAEGSGIMQGYEYEIGGFKRNKFLFTGTTFFAHGLNSDDDLNIGLGGGIFISPILQRDAVKLIPGFNLGFWIYTYDSYYYNDNYYYNDEILYAYEFMWGGPDIRLMLGRTGFFEIFYKMQFGMRYENERGYDYSSYYKFNVKFLWGVGISFSIKGTAGCQCE